MHMIVGHRSTKAVIKRKARETRQEFVRGVINVIPVPVKPKAKHANYTLIKEVEKNGI